MCSNFADYSDNGGFELLTTARHVGNAPQEWKELLVGDCRRHWSLTLARVVLLSALALRAQIGWAQETANDPKDEPAAPDYKLLRFDEDYSYLKDPSRQTDFWDPIKYIPLGCCEDRYLS